jgi:exosome complex RNA-binding protein Csl4
MTFEMFKEQFEEDPELPKEGIRVSVKITKLDEQRVCVEFDRLAGNSRYFYEQFKLLKEALSGINDAALSDE